MKTMVVQRTIDAPLELVFQTISDVRNFSQAVPHITKVEFLTEQTTGVGTRFRETRLMGKKEAATELEVTEYEPNEKIRLVADSHGTVWDTVFTTRQAGGQTEMTMKMDARASGWFAGLMNKLIRGMILKAVESDMDAVKAFCESS